MDDSDDCISVGIDAQCGEYADGESFIDQASLQTEEMCENGTVSAFSPAATTNNFTWTRDCKSIDSR